MNFKFYLTSTTLFLVCSFFGFFVGLKVIAEILLKLFGVPYGEEVLAFTMYSVVLSLMGSFIGIVVALIFIERLGRRWGRNLTFGSHPVLKLTSLSFLSFLVLLFFLLRIYNYFNK